MSGERSEYGAVFDRVTRNVLKFEDLVRRGRKVEVAFRKAGYLDFAEKTATPVDVWEKAVLGGEKITGPVLEELRLVVEQAELLFAATLGT